MTAPCCHTSVLRVSQPVGQSASRPVSNWLASRPLARPSAYSSARNASCSAGAPAAAAAASTAIVKDCKCNAGIMKVNVCSKFIYCMVRSFLHHGLSRALGLAGKRSSSSVHLITTELLDRRHQSLQQQCEPSRHRSRCTAGRKNSACHAKRLFLRLLGACMAKRILSASHDRLARRVRGGCVARTRKFLPSRIAPHSGIFNAFSYL